MQVLLFLLLIQFPNLVTGECRPFVSVSRSGPLNVLAGHSFNLTCYFTCLTAAHNIQMKKNNQEWISLSSTRPASRHNVTLFLYFSAAEHSDSGLYQCRTNSILSLNLRVNVTAHRDLKIRQLRSELSLSSTCSESEQNITLYLNRSAVEQNDSGQDKIDQLDTVSKSPHQAVAAEVKGTCDTPPSWSLLHLPMWYLLCKAAVFLICLLGMVLKVTRQTP